MAFILVGALGIVGVLSRYGLGLMVPAVSGISISVLGANALGSAVGGVLISSPWVAERVPAMWLAAITVGFLGGLTTFSAVSMDTVRLWQSGAVNMALLNLCLNNFTGILACFVGYKIGVRVT